MKLYTKTGDRGETGLYGADRVSKAHARVEAYGTVDELNSLLGLARAHLAAQAPAAAPGARAAADMADDRADATADLTADLTAGLDADLAQLQNALFDLGADLATREGSPYAARLSRMDEQDVAALEQWIDRYQEVAPPFTGFIHPGGTLVAATLQLARAVARRAEREVIRLGAEEPMNLQAQIYLNRLSDLLFVMARAANAHAGVGEDGWRVGQRR